MYGSGVELPGGDTNFDSLELLKKLANDSCDKYLETKVEKIVWNDEEVIVHVYHENFQERIEYKTKHVIVTLPLGVLQSEQVKFEPALDENKLKAIKNLRPGKVCKILLHFASLSWLKGKKEINFMWSAEEIEEGKKNGDWTRSVCSLNEVKNQDDIFSMWVTGDGAVIAEGVSDNEIIEGASKLLRMFSGNAEVEVPYQVTRYPFLRSKHFLGTFSYPSVDTEPEDYQHLLEAVPSAEVPRLLLAGEHTHPTHWSFLHGARSSGIDQADKVLKFLQSQTEE